MGLDLKRERQLLAVLGIALTASGLLRYSTQNELTRLDIGLLIAGGLLILTSIAMSYRELKNFSGHRSAKLGTNTLSLTLIVLAIIGIVNFFGYRHHERIDLTKEKLYTISDQTRNVVKSLNTDVQVLLFASQPDPDFRDLAAQYSSLNSHVHYREVDPQLNPELAAQYNIKQLNQTVVASGTRNETIAGTTEQDLTNGILKVTRANAKTICFAAGHGERDITDTGEDGYANMAHVLTSEGYQTKTFNLVATGGEIPTDCDALVEAGPQKPLLSQESEIIGKYLDDGGKVLLLIDSQMDPNLGDLFHKWNIDLGNNVVIDASGGGRMFGTGPAVPMVVQYGQNPITANFNGTMTFFPLARTVSVADKNNPTVLGVELLKTSERSFTVPNLKTTQIHYDPKSDTIGPLALGVAVTAPNGAEGAAKKTRLVVIGDSMFATNKWAALQRNGDLFLNTMHWLAEDEDLISIQPKSPTNRRIILTETQDREMLWLSLILLPGIVLIAGILLWLRRR